MTYESDGWSIDNKGIQAIPFEVIPMWIIKFYISTWARLAYYFDENVVICFRVNKWSSFRDYPEMLCRKELKKGNGSISDKYSNHEIN